MQCRPATTGLAECGHAVAGDGAGRPDSAGPGWLCFVGTVGWETGATGGMHGGATRKSVKGAVGTGRICGGISPTQLVSTGKAPRDAYYRAIAACWVSGLFFKRLLQRILALDGLDIFIF